MAVPCIIENVDWEPAQDTLWKEYFRMALWYIGCFGIYSKYLVKFNHTNNTFPETMYRSPPLYPNYFSAGTVHNDTRMIGSAVYSNDKLIGMLHQNYQGKAIFCTPESIQYCIKNL